MRLVSHRLMRLYYLLRQRLEPTSTISLIVAAERAADREAWGECYDLSNAALHQDAGLTWGYFLRALARLKLDDHTGALRDIGLFLACVDEPPPLVYYWRGWLYCHRGEWTLALADFDRALGMPSNQLDLHYWRAYAQWQQGEWDGMRESLDYLDRHQASEHPIVAELRGHLYLHDGALDKAEAAYSYALSGGMDSATLRYNRAVTRRLRGRIAGAREDVEALLAAEPENGMAYLELSHLDYYGGDYVQALAHVRRATTLLGDDHLEARGHEIATLSALGDFERAIALLESLAAHHPASPVLAELRGQLYRAAGKCEEAVAAYRALLGLLPDDPEARFHLADALMAMDRYGEAEPLLDGLVADEPEDGEVLALRADLYRHTNRPDAMAGDLEQLLALAPDDPWALTYRATYRQWRGDLCGAERDYHAAITNESAQGWMWAFCGDFYLRRGDLAQARRYFQDAITREPENSWIRRRWADLQWECGDQTTALAVLNWLILDEPEDGHARLSLAERLLQMERFDEAEEALSRIVEQGHELAWLAHAALAVIGDGNARTTHCTHAELLRPEPSFWGITPARVRAQQALLAYMAADEASAAAHLDAAQNALEFGEALWPALPPLMARLGAASLLEQSLA